MGEFFDRIASLNRFARCSPKTAPHSFAIDAGLSPRAKASDDGLCRVAGERVTLEQAGDRWFPDSALEESGFEPPVPLEGRV